MIKGQIGLRSINHPDGALQPGAEQGLGYLRAAGELAARSEAGRIS